jgi:hypothetical protein
MQEIHGPGGGQLLLRANAEGWDPETLRLLAELAAEAWSNASARFAISHGAANPGGLR